MGYLRLKEACIPSNIFQILAQSEIEPFWFAFAHGRVGLRVPCMRIAEEYIDMP